jgi:hypothetical protein
LANDSPVTTQNLMMDCNTFMSAEALYDATEAITEFAEKPGPRTLLMDNINHLLYLGDNDDLNRGRLSLVGQVAGLAIDRVTGLVAVSRNRFKKSMSSDDAPIEHRQLASILVNEGQHYQFHGVENGRDRARKELTADRLAMITDITTMLHQTRTFG